MGIKATNFASSTLQLGIDAVTTAMSVASGQGALFPVLGVGDYCYITLQDLSGNCEIVKATARSGDGFTIVRAQEGTTARAFAGGSAVELRPTVQTMTDLSQLVSTSASGISFTPAGDLSATDVQEALEELDSEKEPADATILKEVNIGVSVQAFDADTAKLDVDQSWTGAQRGAITTDNDLSFDQNSANNFSCTPSGGGTLTFTNHTAGQSGFVLLVNGSNYAIAAAATTKISTADLTKISTTGTYLISYFDNGTNAYCVASASIA